MTPQPPNPATTRRALRLVAALLLVVAVTLLALIASGAFDPHPLGSLARRDRPGPLTLSGRGEMLASQPLPWPAPPARYSVRLTAAHATGETDSAYGLALGDDATLTVAVSPLGQAAVWQTVTGEDEPLTLLPWQPFPHVRAACSAGWQPALQGEQTAGCQPALQGNEIWLDVKNEDGRTRVTARINRELLWEGEVAAPGDGVALWLASFGGAVTVDFQTLDWYAPAQN